MAIHSEGYRFLGRLGRGSSSSIWRAVEKGDGQVVAIKVFHDVPHGFATGAIDLRREGRAAAILTAAEPPGPGFAVAYARKALLVGTEAGERPALVMPLVDGVCLADWLGAGHPADARREVVKQLLRAVGWLHGAGVAHGDLSLGNVLVAQENLVWIVDLGRSAVLAETHADEVSASPSRAVGLFNDPRREASVAGDLRAFAILCALTLAETHPFASEARALFEGPQRADLGQAPRPIQRSRFLSEAEAACLQQWLHPALTTQRGVTAHRMLNDAPI